MKKTTSILEISNKEVERKYGFHGTIALQIVFIFLCVLIGACETKKGKQESDSPPQKSENPVIYEKAKPVELSQETTKEFIQWASGSSLEEREIVREAIGKASKEEVVLSSLFQEYEKVKTDDIGYSLVVISIIGELQNQAALPGLEEIIFEEVPEAEKEFHSGLTKADLVEILASKAVEAAAYLKTETSDSLVLRVVKEHGSKAVRSSAIDAYLYNHDDTEEAKNALKNIVRQEDEILLDRVRFTRNSTKAEFDKGLNSFYEKNPKEVAPIPELSKEKDKKKDSARIELTEPIPPPKRNQQ